ncbi:MAG TPA: hypothetical protein VHT02_02000 [Methylocella sp.]|nr:hypothetical protein [Methylocella sp.]
MKKRLLRLGPAVALGIGAGIAAAVLFSLAIRATFVAAVLANLSPLPIMIATLGYGAFAGAAAVASATVTVAALFNAQQKFGSLDTAALGGLVFAFSLGLPAFWLSLLSVLSRPKGSPNWVVTSRVGSFFAREYVPLERILSYATSICATIGVAIAVYVSSLYGGFDVALDSLSAEVTPIAERLISPGMHLPSDFDARHLARVTVLAAAPAVAASSLVLLMLNLCLAGRVAQLSAQLPRPWPDIAGELRLPQVYLLVFGAAALTGPYLGGLPGHIIVIVAATLGVAFALDGLAAAHYLSRGSPFRIPLLILIYLGLVVPVTWFVFLLLLVLTGVIETAFSLRDRKDKTASPKL